MSKIIDAKKNGYQITYTGEKAERFIRPNGEYQQLSYGDGTTTVSSHKADGIKTAQDSMSFDKNTGKILKKKDANGIESSYSYDDGGKGGEQNGWVNEYLVRKIKTEVDYQELDAAGLVKFLKTDKEKEETKTVTSYDDHGQPTTVTTTKEGAPDSVEQTTYQDTVQGTTQTTTTTQGEEKETSVIKTDAMGRETENTSKDRKGNILSSTETSYDFMGRAIQTKVTSDGVTQTESKTYDDNGTVATETSASGVKTAYQYDSVNRVVKATESADGTDTVTETSYGYEDAQIHTLNGMKDYQDLSVQTTKTNGRVSEKSWTDAAGQTVRSFSHGLYTDHVFTSDGKEIATISLGTKTSGDGKIALQLYDKEGKQTAAIQNPEITKGTSDAVVKVGNSSILQKTEYDTKGNETTKTDGNGDQISYAYDDQNRVTEITQGGQKTKVSYQVNSDGSTTTSVTDANGHVKQETASASGSVTTTSDLGDGSESITTKYTYDDRGNKLSEVYANGAKKTYEYNSRNLVVKTQSYDKEGTKTLTSRYRYDDKGQLSEMTDYSVSSETETAYRYTEYSYDTRGRITTFAEISQNAQPTADDIKAHQIRYTYNENGNLSKVSYPTTKDGIQSLSYIYDENGWLQEIKGELHSKGQTTEKVLRSYSYDAYGKVKEIKDYRNRLKNGAQAVQKIYTYDSFDRVKEMTYTDLETGKVMESYRYSYDKNSNITEKTEVNNYPKEEKDKVNETKAYTYDALGRLTKTVTTDHKNDDRTKTVTYTYDKAGNRTKEDDGTTQTAYTYNGLDQLQTATKEKGTAVDEVRQYSYDANGNQTDVKNTKTGQTESYTYDAENRLSKVSVTDKDGKTAVIQQNRYNGDGQRIQKVEGSKTTNYYYQDGVVSYTTDGENSQTSQNLIGTDGNILATQRYGSDHTDYLLYHKDIQGSTTSLVKEDGSADATYRYTDFGETMINGDNKAENEVCYTGGIYDHSTGLYYLNARYYNPEDGRFVTEDTYRGETAKPETGHLYAYCANNPVNYVDPSGHKYDKHAAANYALRWGMSFNPEYANHTGQGDCTNFVSQCVHAGGVPMRRPRSVYARPDIYRTNMYWYSVRYKNYRNAYRWKETTAWTTVKGFFAHWKFKKNTKIIKCKNLEELKKKVDLGDIVQLHSRKEGWHHSIIISVKESSKICYAGHSKRHKWANINKIKKGQDKYRIIRFK
jgi:RHS repeat-associated protein